MNYRPISGLIKASIHCHIDVREGAFKMQPSEMITRSVIKGPKLNYQWIYIPKTPVDSILKIETMLLHRETTDQYSPRGFLIHMQRFN